MARHEGRRLGRHRWTLFALVALFAAIPLVVATAASASHAFVVQNDVQLADDQPGQKDLSLHGLDSSHGSGQYWVMWQWDVTNLSGGNTGDACALLDNDANSKVDFAICVTIERGATGSQQKSTSPRLFSCGDTKVDRCTTPITLLSLPSGWSCSVNTNANDPFHTNPQEKDTQAVCFFDIDDVGGGTAKLVNTCSYPSDQPNSDPSDCVLLPRDAFLRVVKVAGGDTTTEFDFVVDSGANQQAINDVRQGEAASSNEVAITSTATHSLKETIPAGWNLDSASCTGSTENPPKNGTFSTDTISGIDAKSDDVITCTFTNSVLPGTLIVNKVVTNDNGGGKGCADFSFQVDGGSATTFDADCSNSVSVVAGQHDVTEPAVTGYETSYSNCDDVNVPAGGSATCTITNNDRAATLTVVKDLTKDNGGTATCSDFKFTRTGGSETAFEGDCSNALTVNAGTYSVVETAAAGYTTTYTNCSNIVLANGGSATCTIHNDDDAGTLIVTKVVDNADGVGSKTCANFSFQVDGGGATAFEADCSNSVAVPAGTYDVTEPAVAGYETSYSNCENVVVANGGTATCTITNTVKAFKLIVLVCKDGALYSSNVTLPSGQNEKQSLPSGTAGEADLCALGGAAYLRGIGTYSPEVEIGDSEAP